MKSTVVGKIVLIEEIAVADYPKASRAIRRLLAEEAIVISINRVDHMVLIPARDMQPIEVKVSFDRLVERDFLE